jgi:predicted sugar kinase
MLGLLPAVLEHDLAAFGSALSAVQEIVGTCFAAVQGGRYGCIEAEGLVERLCGVGLQGVGQSSWGPTLYAFSDAPLPDRHRVLERLRNDPAFADYSLDWTVASLNGAKMTIERT